MRASFMRSVPFLVDSNEYLSQGSAINALAIDEVNRNTAHVFGSRDGLVKWDWILGANSLQSHFTHS